MLWTPTWSDRESADDSGDDVPEVSTIGQQRHSYLQKLGVGTPRSRAFSTPDMKAHTSQLASGRDAFRGKFLQKLAYNNVWVPQAQRPPKHQSVILFDWDDTLLCTSFLNREAPTAETMEHVSKIADHVKTLLEVALKSGHTYIITNASAGWVEYSAAKWMPEILPMLRQVQVISARERFEAEFPDDINQWKIQAFLEVQRHMASTPITNLVALGDADFEMEAVRVMGKEFEESLIKTIKFRPQPTSLEHLKELELVATRFEQIVRSGRNLKIFLERRSSAKPEPST